MRLTVAVSGLYPLADVWTLRTLKAQTDKDFRLLFIDPGWDDTLSERLERFSRRSGVETVRVPYKLPPGRRVFDWGQWNTPFLLSESEDDFVLRLQSWRLIPTNFIEEVRRMNRNVGFCRHFRKLSPAQCLHYASTPGEVFMMDWSGKGQQPHFYKGYGDWCLRTRDFLNINGLDEPATMLFHGEDQDMEVRWDAAVNKGLVEPGRAVVGLAYLDTGECRALLAHALEADAVLHKGEFRRRCKQPCPECMSLARLLNVEANPALPAGTQSLGVIEGKPWLYRPCCELPVFNVRGYFNDCRTHHRASVGLLGRFGRNLRRTRNKATSLPQSERMGFVVNSYEDEDCLRED